MSNAVTACEDGVQPSVGFSMAFQPIVDIQAEKVFAYEALVRGLHNEGAHTVLSQITPENRYNFDQSCRVRAIAIAARLGVIQTDARLSINFMPGAVYSPPSCIQLTLAMAKEMAFPIDRLIFEITEGEEVQDPGHLQSISDEYRKHGLQVAIDDFGAGFANLNLLADLHVDILKLDMALSRDLHLRPRASSIVRGVVEICKQHNITVVAEGVETTEEFFALQNCGIHLMQGYLIARPAFQELPGFTLPVRRTSRSMVA